METEQSIKLNLSNQPFLDIFNRFKVRIVAPASGCEPSLFKSLLKLKDTVNIEIPETLINDSTPFHANTDSARFHDIRDALLDDHIDVIWALRGGYGSARIIDQLFTVKKPKKEKIFIGFSDITALHLFLSQQWHWKTIHGHGISKLLKPNCRLEDFTLISDLILDRSRQATLEKLKPLNNAAQKATSIEGLLTGGNATLVQTSIGTAWQIQTNNKILFLEDVNEKAYKVDRLLNHYLQAGLFKSVKAIVFGDFFDTSTDPSIALNRFAKEQDIPIFQTPEFGHSHINRPLIYQSKAKILAEQPGFKLVMPWH